MSGFVAAIYICVDKWSCTFAQNFVEGKWKLRTKRKLRSGLNKANNLLMLIVLDLKIYVHPLLV